MPSFMKGRVYKAPYRSPGLCTALLLQKTEHTDTSLPHMNLYGARPHSIAQAVLDVSVMLGSNPGLETLLQGQGRKRSEILSEAQLPKLLGHKTVLGHWSSGPALAPFLALSQTLSHALPMEQTHWGKGHC